MAYQNVGTPRFYINDISYAKSIGIDITDIPEEVVSGHKHPQRFNDYDKLFDDDPTNQVIFTPESEAEFWVYAKTFKRPDNEPNYVAYLNHNIKESSVYIRHTNRKLGDSDWNDGTSLTEIVNGVNGGVDVWEGNSIQTTYVKSEYNGFTICEIGGTIDGINNDIHNFQFYMDRNEFALLDEPKEFRIGCIFVGRYYDMPVSPDLDLSMTTEFDGYDTTTTLGGSTLTNVRYTGAPWWRDSEGNKIEPWSVGESNGVSKRNGRRVWSMKFSYLSDKDIFSSNYMSNTYLESGSGSGYESDDLTTDGNNFEYTLENDDSFVAQVLNKVGNGQRFIFQPDNTNNNPDQFAICQLDQDSLQIKQVAFNTYSISLNIREVW
jgi:hypothetical protein